MTRALVTVGFIIHDKENKGVFINEGDRINYERYDDDTCIKIFHYSTRELYDVPAYFPIEDYVEVIPEPLLRLHYPVEHVQIQRIEGQGNTNDFLLGIPRENVIDVKPMENNTYLIIYAEEEHEENKV